MSKSDDLISRQAAIDAVEFGITYAKAINKDTGETIELFKQANEELRKAVERINQLPSAQPEPQWIPCSERLPQPNEEDADGFIKAYLVQDGRWMDVARWNGDCWIAWGYGTALTNVTAWMPLPEPYKGRRTDD